MVFALRHALYFLNQTGALSLNSLGRPQILLDGDSAVACGFSVNHRLKDALAGWTQAPCLVSVRNLDEGVTVAFDNGLYGTLSFNALEAWRNERPAALADDGLIFASGKLIASADLYRRLVEGLDNPGPARPIGGISFRSCGPG